MALEQKLTPRLQQRLVMTPALQLAIRLLQLNRLELEGVLQQEMNENPLLEEQDQQAEADPTTDDDADDADASRNDCGRRAAGSERRR